MSSLLAHESLIRVAVFLGVLGIMALWEIATPRRRLELPKLLRWSNNLGLVALDAALVRLMFPVAAVGLAVLAEERGWGLFNSLGWPSWIAVPLAGGHATAQSPQCAVSLVTSTHASPQRVKPAEHAIPQTPAVQVPRPF